MPDVILEGLQRTFPGRNATVAIDDVSIRVNEGEILALLGPSGCGKTTTLRCVAGLEEPDAGRIVFGDRVVFDAQRGVRVPANRRGLGLVFQSYALWPHMSAYRNIEFPLRAAHLPRAQRASRVEEVAATVDLDLGLLEKRPGQMSGGQQQRVALARALVNRPNVLLFDEPLSNLDAHLRAQLRAEIHALHQRLGFTAIYVTHDLNEALALGNQIAVMRRGKVAQHGTPLEVFEEPADTDVARLLGFRKLAEVGDESFGSNAVLSGSSESDVRDAAQAYVRPDRLRITRPDGHDAPGIIVGGFHVDDVAYLGDSMETTLSRSGEAIQVRSQRGVVPVWWQAGDEVSLSVDASALALFDAAGSAIAGRVDAAIDHGAMPRN